MSKSIKLYALKSNYSGRYFKFYPYGEGPHGVCIDDIEYPFTSKSMPTFFNEDEVSADTRESGYYPFSILQGHKHSDVSVSEFSLVTEVETVLAGGRYYP